MLELNTAALEGEVSRCLSWLQDLGFRYFKSYRHFRLKTDSGHCYIAIDPVTHNRIRYHLAFYISSQVRVLEEQIKSLHRLDVKLDHYDRSIWSYTVDIGPNSHHWKYPISGDWSIERFEEIAAILPEVNRFIEDLALPYVTGHTSAEAVRQTLIDKPGHAQNIYPYEQILAASMLVGERDRLRADIEMLSERYQEYAAGPRERFDSFVAKVLGVTS